MMPPSRRNLVDLSLLPPPPWNADPAKLYNGSAVGDVTPKVTFWKTGDTRPTESPSPVVTWAEATPE
jgi:hypothetical protein